MQKKAVAPDGTTVTTHLIHAAALAEARSPQSKGNEQATEHVVALAEKMANAALVAMRDPRRAIASLLTSEGGADAVGKDATKHEATVGAHVTYNCRVESNFGCIDVLMRMYRYTTVENISGVAQHSCATRTLSARHASTMGAGASGSKTQSRSTPVSSTPASPRSSSRRSSSTRNARRAAIGAQSEGWLARKAHDDEKLERRADRLLTLLTAAVERYAYALELFDAWAAQRERGGLTKPAIKKALHDENGKDKPEAHGRSSSTSGFRSRCACSASAGPSMRRAGRRRPTTASAQSPTSTRCSRRSSTTSALHAGHRPRPADRGGAAADGHGQRRAAGQRRRRCERGQRQGDLQRGRAEEEGGRGAATAHRSWHRR